MVFVVEDRKKADKVLENSQEYLTFDVLEKIFKDFPSDGHQTSFLGMQIYGISTLTDFNTYLYSRNVNVEASIEPSKNFSQMNIS